MAHRAPALIAVLWLMQSASPVNVKNEDDFRVAMVSIDDATAVIERATASSVYLLNSVRGDALSRHDVILTNLAAVRGFFEHEHRAEAQKLAEDALSALGVLRAELAAAEPDQASAAEAVAHLQTRCTACHERYREGDERGGYRLRR